MTKKKGNSVSQIYPPRNVKDCYVIAESTCAPRPLAACAVVCNHSRWHDLAVASNISEYYASTVRGDVVCQVFDEDATDDTSRLVRFRIVEDGECSDLFIIAQEATA